MHTLYCLLSSISIRKLSILASLNFRFSQSILRINHKTQMGFTMYTMYWFKNSIRIPCIWSQTTHSWAFSERMCHISSKTRQIINGFDQMLRILGKFVNRFDVYIQQPKWVFDFIRRIHSKTRWENQSTNCRPTNSYQGNHFRRHRPTNTCQEKDFMRCVLTDSYQGYGFMCHRPTHPCQGNHFLWHRPTNPWQELYSRWVGHTNTWQG